LHEPQARAGLVCEFEQRWPQPGQCWSFVKQQMRGSLAFLICEVFTDTKKESLWLIMGGLEDRAGSDKSISLYRRLEYAS